MQSKLTVNLADIFNSLQTENYVIIKANENYFDHLRDGGDIDIFTLDPKRIIQAISSYVGSNHPTFSTEVTRLDHQLHIDILENDRLIIRFDLYLSMPTYKNINVKNSFFEWTISRSTIIEKNGIYFSIPHKIDDCVLRVLEFNEYYYNRPDKIKHLNYIETNCTNIEISQALSLLHYFTKLPQPELKKLSRYKKFKQNLRMFYTKIIKLKKFHSKNGINKTIIKIIQHVKK